MIDRGEPQVLHVPGLPAEQATRPGIAAGVTSRVVSEDPDSAARTVRLDLQPGWSANGPADGALEVFVLEGKLDLGDHELGAGGYAYIPESAGAMDWGSEEGAQVLAFWRPQPAAAGVTDLIALSSWDLPWHATVLPGFPIGGMHKSLRPGDDADGAEHGGIDGFLRLVLVCPGWMSPMQERHVGCWEENILLRGDMLMPERGTLRSGDCLANPAGFWHGPMTTKGGALFMVNCDAPMGVEYRDYPGGETELRRYLATAPWA